MEGRIIVQRANVVLRIRPEEKNYYMQQGYSIIDENGAMVEEAMSTDVATLQTQVAKLKTEIQELKAQLKTKTAKSRKSVDEEK